MQPTCANTPSLPLAAPPPCSPGSGGPNCTACGVGYWSPGGNSSDPIPPCRQCPNGLITPSKGNALESDCSGRCSGRCPQKSSSCPPVPLLKVPSLLPTRPPSSIPLPSTPTYTQSAQRATAVPPALPLLATSARRTGTAPAAPRAAGRAPLAAWLPHSPRRQPTRACASPEPAGMAAPATPAISTSTAPVATRQTPSRHASPARLGLSPTCAVPRKRAIAHVSFPCAVRAVAHACHRAAVCARAAMRHLPQALHVEVRHARNEQQETPLTRTGTARSDAA